MKKLLAALTLICILSSPALAQKTKAALTTEVNTNLASSNGITASALRTTILDIINSYYDLNGLTSVSCGSNTFVNAFPTLSSVTCTQPTIANISGFGAGVATALGVNVGTVGAPVINGDVLGTPSSGTATNLTGTAAGLTAGTFTAGSASNLNAGTLPAARMPALTGDCTTSAGAVATTCTKTNNVAFTGAATATYTSAGSWTPSDISGASLTFTGVSVSYTQIGNMVFIYGALTYPATGSGANTNISGLPVAVPNQNYAAAPCTVGYTGNATLRYINLNKNTSSFSLYTSAGASVTNVQMSGSSFQFWCVYPAS